MKLFKEYQDLLMRREARVIIGRHASNFWLLVMVLTATFFSIAFSSGSMDYLKEKMNDPFTNWVNINRDASLEKIGILRDSLENESIRQRYLFDGIQTEINASLDLVSPSGKVPLFSILYYEDMGSDLIAAVLSEDNVVNGLSIDADSISENSLGVIMTADALEHLGFNRNNPPSFVDCHQKAEGADTLGYDLLDGDYVRSPLPLLAVVKRLPMNKEMVSSKYLYKQLNDDAIDKPFNMNNEKYVRKLRFFVPEEVTDFDLQHIQTVLPDSLRNSAYVDATEERVQQRLLSWKKGHIMSVEVGFPGTPVMAYCSVEKEILKLYEGKGVVRVYDYNESMKETMEELNDGENSRNTTSDDVISAHFIRLDSIRPFERYVKQVSELQIEMTQVNSKENFNAVSVMAGILSVAMVVFSIVCIIMFLVNMLQSYFQKVKRNIGTFKAFGMNAAELINVYVVILVCIVCSAVVFALFITWLVQVLLPLMGVEKDGFNYLCLWNVTTYVATAVILLSTIATVIVVMSRMLNQTPGDLIYDRG